MVDVDCPLPARRVRARLPDEPQGVRHLRRGGRAVGVGERATLAHPANRCESRRGLRGPGHSKDPPASCTPIPAATDRSSSCRKEVLMNGSVWQEVVDGLRERYRCIVPELPFGAHGRPMSDGADLALPSIARMVAEFLVELDLREVTLVCNDWGGAQLVISPGRSDRVANLVLGSCEAFDNYPPGLPGRLLCLSAALPGGLFMAAQMLRAKWIRHLPPAFGNLSKKRFPTSSSCEFRAEGVRGSRGRAAGTVPVQAHDPVPDGPRIDGLDGGERLEAVGPNPRFVVTSLAPQGGAEAPRGCTVTLRSGRRLRVREHPNSDCYSQATPSPSPSCMCRYAGWPRGTGATPWRRASAQVMRPLPLSS